ncbi:hypothetical protein KP509_09G069600 [Ceratopteris richardii]|uniref:Protein kinase domain-containing protein n=1 Tax=Ceratopteris richardii TaxID=49495 RepID=A0A8T2U2B1_CERRI|nr:hypothetical protein KP509_09G069600 [Ceratopteris richardii]
MDDPIRTVLEFLHRNQFAMAEAAFKAELSSRSKGENPILSSENIQGWDLQLSSPLAKHTTDTTQSIGVSVSTRNVQMMVHATAGEGVSASEKKVCNASSSNKNETRVSSIEISRSPPEKQLYVEYESGQGKSREPLHTLGQDFAFVNNKTLFDPITRTCSTGADMSSIMRDFGNSTQRPSHKNLCKDLDWPLSDCMEVSTSRSYSEGCQSLSRESKLNSDPEHEDSELQRPFNVYVNTSTVQNPDCLLRETGEQGKETSNLMQSSVEKQQPYFFQAEKGIPGLRPSAIKAKSDSGKAAMWNVGDTPLQLQNGFVPSSPKQGAFKEPSFKTAFPVSLMKPIQMEDQEKKLTLELTDSGDERDAGGYGWNSNDSQKFGSSVPVSSRKGEVSAAFFSSQDLSANGPNASEIFPRLPPVRIHSVDKNMDLFKEGGPVLENENSTRSVTSTSEGALGWGVLADGLVGQDIIASGVKRPVLRPSVSQGIIEDLSEQLSGFTTVADEGWYPDVYCDSDTWEDDDDPGYHRQPIEDEEWFLAHEIDYPSDDERGKCVDKSHTLDAKQPKKKDEDGKSLVEEDSYFTGEECYRRQITGKEAQRLQISEAKDQMALPEASRSTMFPMSCERALLNLSRSNGDGNDYDSQFYESEMLSLMTSQSTWKGFEYQGNQLEQIHSRSSGYRCDDFRGNEIDDDNHGSVRSGLIVSSDAADIGSEVRESLLGGSSEGDAEGPGYQEEVTYGASHGKFKSQDYLSTKERHIQVKNAPVCHLDEDENDHKMGFKYYKNERAHSKESNEIGFMTGNHFDLQLQAKEQPMGRRTNSCKKKGGQDNGGFVFEGFSFPSPSSTGDIEGSRPGSGKSLWSNRESVILGEEADGHGIGLVGPGGTLAAWKRKSSNSSPGIGSSEDNLTNSMLLNHSSESVHSTDEYVSLEAREDSDTGGHNIEDSVHKVGEPSAQEEDDAAITRDELRTLGADEDQYEIFNLRIIHRKNRTGFEEDKEFPIVINSVVAGRYHVTEYLGSAAFSKAIQAHDLDTDMDVCLKIIKNNKDFFDQSLDEIKLLKYVNKHDPLDKYHILRLYDYFYHREHLFIVCELLRANLYEFHKFNRESGGEVYFTMPRLQSIALQCLEALEFLHRLGIIHCDLKPENILVKSYSRCEIKIIDLGSSCFQTDHLCPYVQSRSYRAPEVLFQNDSLATLLARVVGILGPIDADVLAKGRDTHKYFTKNHMLYERNQESDQLEYLIPKKTSLSHRLPMADKGFVEFVGYLLQSNPVKRPTASEALQHPWLSYPYEPISS